MSQINYPKNDKKELLLSRRSFTKGLAAAGILSTMPFGLQMAQNVMASVPKGGGVLRMGIPAGNTSDSLDPATINNMFQGNLHMAIHNLLVEIDEKGGLRSELAEKWDVSKDCKNWVFELRKGVNFSNGAPVEAKDVVASYNHHRTDESKSAAKALLKDVDEIKAEGKNRIIINLKNPNADFGYIASDVHLSILPSKDGKIDWASGIGAGPYILKKFQPGVNATFEKNPNYWKKNRAHFDAVKMLVISDSTARENALRSGQVDVITRVDLKTVDFLDKTPGVKIAEVTGSYHVSIPMLTDVSPFNNNDVRMALKHSIDREAMLKTLYHNRGAIGNDQPLGPSYKYHDSELPQNSYDIDKAKHYLKKAGMSKLIVPLHTADGLFPEAVDMAIFYKEHAAKAGITINIVKEPKDGYWNNVWRKKPWSFCTWKGRPTEDWMLSTAYGEEANWNDTNWKNDRFNKLLVTARAELDEEKRRNMYSEMQKIISQQGGVVIPIFSNYIMAHTDKLAHGSLLSYADFDGFKLAERWWFDK